MCISNSWKDALSKGLISLTTLVTLTDLIGINIFVCLGIEKVWLRFCTFFIAFFLLVGIIKIFINMKKAHQFKIRGIDFNICVKNIFDTEGLKIIPFNERFDTDVDDVVISKNTLNGKFLMEHSGDLQNIKATIKQQINDRKLADEHGRVPLGTIIKYNNDYAFLALTHFNDKNEAHITKVEYEQCLLKMWQNICEIYSGYDIVLPLIGAGITRFDDVAEKSDIDLIKCMLCTFKDSQQHFSSSITITVLDKTWKNLNLKDNNSICKT